jgi:hypothetical protein
METLDLRKELKHLYSPSAKKAEMVDVPALQFAMVDGAIEKGFEPGNSPLFQENMQALYGISYTLKFMVKQRKNNPVNYPVMALEGLWWVEDGRFDINVKDNWFYRVMILQPDLVTEEVFAEGLAELRKKKGDLPALGRLRLESFREGLCAQMMHIGPYAQEPATMEKIEAFARENGYKRSLRHHEIYMGNPLRAAPEKLRTILRVQVEKGE